jgi:hypothetical protein
MLSGEKMEWFGAVLSVSEAALIYRHGLIAEWRRSQGKCQGLAGGVRDWDFMEFSGHQWMYHVLRMLSGEKMEWFGAVLSVSEAVLIYRHVLIAEWRRSQGKCQGLAGGVRDWDFMEFSGYQWMYHVLRMLSGEKMEWFGAVLSVSEAVLIYRHVLIAEWRRSQGKCQGLAGGVRDRLTSCLCVYQWMYWTMMIL